MTLYRGKVFHWHTPRKVQQFPLSNFVDITDAEVQNTISTLLNKGKKIPAASIALVNSLIQIEFTQQTREFKPYDRYIVADTLEDAKRQIYLLHVMAESHRNVIMRHWNPSPILPQASTEIKLTKPNPNIKCTDKTRGNKYYSDISKIRKTFDSETYEYWREARIQLLAYNGILRLDWRISKEEVEIQEALGQIADVIKTTPVCINEQMFDFITKEGGKPFTIHKSAHDAIKSYNATRGEIK